MTDDPGPPSSGIDTSSPNGARTYDYLLGGDDSFPSDRAVGDKIKRELPGAVAIAVANRKALGRAVRHLVQEAGIRQFLDLGSGLPTAGNVHQIARRHAPESRVVYVDDDPAVPAHGRALLAGDDRATMLWGDLREPHDVLNHPAVRRLIDFGEPVGVILSAILHHLLDEEDAPGVVAALRDAVAPGSHVFITHFRAERGAGSRRIQAMLQQAFGCGRWRDDAEIAGYFTGLELLEPGILPVVQWRPEAPLDREPTAWERVIVGGLGRKP